MTDDTHDELFVEAIDFYNLMVVTSKGETMAIIAVWDDDYIEVERIEDASVVLCGSPEQGYFEFDILDHFEPVTVH